MSAWTNLRRIKRKKRSGNLRQSKELLASLLGICRPGVADNQEESGVGADLLPGKPSQPVSLAANDQRESGVFNYLEKKSEKRIFYSYLNRFELTREHLGPKVSRRLLSEIFKHSNAVSRRFDEPLASVSPNVIGAAAWGTIYCLLGPTRMIEMAPDYQEILDEVELELLTSSSEQDSENSIYHGVFSILIDHRLCHPEVLVLIDTCIDVSPEHQWQDVLQRRPPRGV